MRCSVAESNKKVFFGSDADLDLLVDLADEVLAGARECTVTVDPSQ